MKHIFLTLFILFGAFGLRAQWQPVNGPDGGGGYGIVQLGPQLFASTFSGVYLSDDNGASWHLGGLRGSPIFRILPSSGYLYAAANDTLYKSSDGKNWSTIKTFAGEPITAITELEGGLYISVWETLDSLTGGVYRTLNGGSSFERLTVTMNFTNVRSLVSSGSSLLAFTYRSGIYRSTDHGLSWKSSLSGVPANPVIQSAHLSGSTIYAAGDNLFLRSTNDGVSWQSMARNGLSLSGHSEIYDFFAENNTVMASMSLGDTMMVSTDGGDNWSKLFTTSLPYVNSYYSFSKIGNEVYVQCNAGFYSTTNIGSTWTQKNNGVRTLHINSVFSHQGYLLALGGDVKLYGSNDGGTTWGVPSWLGLEENEQVRGAFFHFDIDVNLFCPYGSYLREFSSISLVGKTTTSPLFSSPQTFKNKMYAFEGSNLVSFAGTSQYDSRTSYNLPFLSSAAMFPRSTDMMLFGDGAFVTSVIVMRILDGSSPTFLDTINGVSNATGFASLHSANFVGFRYGGIYRSTNGGFSWARLANISGSAEVYYLTSFQDSLFASINDINTGLVGLYSSVDDGLNWTFIGGGLPECYSLAMHSDGYMYAGTSEGVYRRQIFSSVAREYSSGDASIYPNPAVDHITVSDGIRHITLYSLLGEKIFEYNVIKESRIDLPHLAKGMYILQATKGTEILTSKLAVE